MTVFYFSKFNNKQVDNVSKKYALQLSTEEKIYYKKINLKVFSINLDKINDHIKGTLLPLHPHKKKTRGLWN